MPLYTDFRSPNHVVTDASAINDAIKNILLTRIGSVPGKPTFGSSINEVLFSQLDHITEDILITKVQDALAKWEPRILLDGVTVKAVPEFNKLVLTINYQYTDKGLNINESMSVALMH